MTGKIQVLEQGKSPSESLLFTLLTDYYRDRGPRAWDETPCYPTNNAFLAEAYAALERKEKNLASLRNFAVCYVLTDIVEANLQSSVSCRFRGWSTRR